MTNYTGFTDINQVSFVQEPKIVEVLMAHENDLKAKSFAPTTIAAAGPNQAGATPITSTLVEVTGATGSNGVVLPADAPVGSQYSVYSAAATNDLRVYPAVGEFVNEGAVNVHLAIPARTRRTFIKFSATKWHG